MPNNKRKRSMNKTASRRTVSSEADAEFVHTLVKTAFEQMEAAYESDALDRLKELEELVLGIALVKDLLRAFQTSLDQNIDGNDGVAAKLKLSRNGVYCRLDMVKLDPADFRHPQVYLGELIKKSRYLRRLAEKLQVLPEREVLID